MQWNFRAIRNSAEAAIAATEKYTYVYFIELSRRPQVGDSAGESILRRFRQSATIAKTMLFAAANESMIGSRRASAVSHRGGRGSAAHHKDVTVFRALMTFVVGMAFGAAGMWGGFTYHLVRTDDGVLMIPRVAPMLLDAYVDVRQFAADDWKQHPRVTYALIKAGYRSVIENSLEETISKDYVKQMQRSSFLEPGANGSSGPL